MSEPTDATLEIDAPSSAPTADFAGAMQQLADEVGRPRHPEPAVAPSSKAARAEFLLVIGQMIRPLAVGVETLGRTLSEHGQTLAKLASAPVPVPPPPAPPAPPPVDLSPVNAALDGVRQQLSRLGGVETANQKLFDALHTELKGYKDGFLFDALQKPFVRDLIALQDDLSALHTQIEARRQAAAGDEAAFLHRLAQNFDNTRHGLQEVFSRLDVEPQRTPAGEPADKRTQRILSFEPAAAAAQDNCVARSVRPGFAWRGRSIRPEDVVVQKWTAPVEAPVAASPES